MILEGTGVSSGISMGKALVLEDENIAISKRGREPVEEIARFKDALGLAKEQLNTLKEKVAEEQRGILEAQVMMLEDPLLLNQVESGIREQSVSAEFAVEQVMDSFITLFEGMTDEYMKERSLDVIDLKKRLIKNLIGLVSSLNILPDDVIIVADDLTPSHTAEMDREKVLGFVLFRGGKTSHTAIMARSLQIPAVVGVSGEIMTGDFLAIDGASGVIYVNPDEETIEIMKERRKAIQERKLHLEKLKGVSTETLDGKRVELVANIGSIEDLEYVVKNDAEGIGLFRTEFLFMNRDTAPDEEEQYKVYKEILKTMAGKPVVVRTLDIGGDKDISYLDLPKEMNPFLGYRGIRLCLGETDLFKTQLRALLRSSIYGNLKIMYPMIASLTELQKANGILKEVREELSLQGLPFGEVEVGIMIETPAAALISDVLAREVDFFSIGTNDLTQYTLAVDRLNERITSLYDSFHPAVLSLVETTIKNGHANGIWVGMCGEAAGDRRMIPILLAMGLDEFSMNPSDILPARELIRSLKRDELEKLLVKIRGLSTGEEVRKLIDGLH